MRATSRFVHYGEVFFLPLLAMAFLLPLPCSGQRFSLDGYVVNGVTGLPVPGTRLHLYSVSTYEDYLHWVGLGRVAEAKVADADGHFTFTGLAPHAYSFQAELPHEIAVYGEAEDPVMPFGGRLYLLGERHIDVGPKSEGRTVIFRVAPQAVLTGSVRDEFGDPYERLTVEIYRWERLGARIRLAPYARTFTDDRGEYAFEGLSSGEYVVCADPGTDGGNLAKLHSPTAEGLFQYRPGGSPPMYVRTCAPDRDPSAGRFQIEAGGRPRLDVKLHSTRTFPLQLGEGQSSGFEYYALERNDGTGENVPFANEVRVPGKSIEISYVAPGHYVVERGFVDKGMQVESVARQEIELADKPLPPILLQPVPVASVEFHLRDVDGNTLDDHAATVSFVPTDARLRVRHVEHSPAVALDPGAYWLSVSARPPFCATSAYLGAGQEDILRERLVLAPGTSATLNVRLSKNCGTINLLTTSSGGEALPFSNFLLLLSGTPQDPGGAITGSSDSKGHASIGPIAPGKYMIWAWSSNGDGYIGPELSGAAGFASGIDVAAGQSTTLSISPIRSSSH